MLFHAFRITNRADQDIFDVLGHISSLELTSRTKEISENLLRAEHIEINGDFALADFVRLKRNGPGKAKAGSPIEDISLDEDDFFGHETAILLSKRKNLIISQYNHTGPRIGKMGSYINVFAKILKFGRDDIETNHAEYGYLFNPIVNRDVMARFERMSIAKKIAITIDAPGAIVPDGGRTGSLSHLLDRPLLGGVSKLHIELSAGRERRSSIDSIKDLVNDALKLGDSLEKLVIEACDDEDSPREPLDLLGGRLELDINVPIYSRRPARKDRYNALYEAYRTWSSGSLI